ncbi:MAG TPA: sugar kinase [Micromonosporaceae bacterium]|nr:sugar kinase [Micromonosporaceae bacterium]
MDVTAGHSARALQAFNQRRVLSNFFEHGTLSRREIGALTGLSKPTVSQVLTRLEAAGIVMCTGVSTVSGPGPNAQLYELNGRVAHVAGVDMADHRVTVEVADLVGRVVGRCELPTDQDPVSGVRQAIETATTKAGIGLSALSHIVVGVPAAVNPRTGALSYTARLTRWATADLPARLHSQLGVGITMENDVNLAAIAEQHDGHAIGHTDFAVLWVSTGVGLALVIDGNPHRGATGAAGEIGHARLAFDTPHRSALGGEFENLVGADAVRSLAQEHGLTGEDPTTMVQGAANSLLWPKPAGGQPAGDQAAFLGALADRITIALGVVAAVIDPQLIVLNGDLLRAGGEQLRGLIERRLHALDVPQPTVALTGVKGNAVVGGAIHLAMRSARATILDSGHAR